MDSRKILQIRVTQRHRRDVGDLSDLKASMSTIGLLHPIVINEKNALVAGERRLLAAKELGWHDVPVRMVRSLTEAVKVLTAERDENTCRKDFLPSEAVALARDLEPFEREASKAEQRKSRGRGKKGAGNSHTFSGRAPVAKDKIAAAVGVDDKMDRGGMVFWSRESFGTRLALNSIPGLFDQKIQLAFEKK